jgi:hypothetical protein
MNERERESSVSRRTEELRRLDAYARAVACVRHDDTTRVSHTTYSWRNDIDSRRTLLDVPAGRDVDGGDGHVGLAQALFPHPTVALW